MNNAENSAHRMGNDNHPNLLNDGANTSEIEEMYQLCQELKLCLLKWQHSSRLGKAQIALLRKRSKKALATSSSNILMRYYRNEGIVK